MQAHAVYSPGQPISLLGHPGAFVYVTLSLWLLESHLAHTFTYVMLNHHFCRVFPRHHDDVTLPLLDSSVVLLPVFLVS